MKDEEHFIVFGPDITISGRAKETVEHIVEEAEGIGVDEGEGGQVAVIGAGPAGIAAAIQLQRTGHRPLVFEAHETGGLLRNADLVENYPGFPGGVGGRELVALMATQMEMLGIDVRRERVKEVRREGGGYAIATSAGELRVRAVIVAAGTSPKAAGIPGEETLGSDRLHYGVADMEMKELGDRKVLVVGGGDAAFDHALHLHKAGARPAIVFRAVEAVCLPLLARRVEAREEILVLPGTSAIRLEEASDGLEATLERAEEGGGVTWDVLVDHCLIAVGRKPNIKIVSGYTPPSSGTLDMEPDGFPGLFLAGDLRRGRMRQAAIAAGDGLLAAMRAAEYLEGREPAGAVTNRSGDDA
jgi:thioredoxin reductase (NADPH)